MRLIDIIRALNGEQLDEKRSKRNAVTARKSKMPVYKTINDGLGKTKAGAVWSTKRAKRTYVTTKDGWGTDKSQRVAGRTAKGFTPGSSTPGSGWKSILGHASRTKKKHNTQGTNTIQKKRGKR